MRVLERLFGSRPDRIGIIRLGLILGGSIVRPRDSS
jgi:hypothetical protein